VQIKTAMQRSVAVSYEMKLIFMFSHKFRIFSKLLIFSHTVGTVSFEIMHAVSYVKGNFVITFKVKFP